MDSYTMILATRLYVRLLPGGEVVGYRFRTD